MRPALAEMVGDRPLWTVLMISLARSQRSEFIS
jgi:hypothetical protein